MSRSQRLRRSAVLFVGLALISSLAACGRQGSLERPAPLFGSRARAEYEAQKAQEARDDAQRRAQSSGVAEPEASRANSRREVLDPNQTLSPASSAPLPGAPNPLGGPVSATPAR